MPKSVLAALLPGTVLPSAARAQALGLGLLIADGAVLQRGKPPCPVPIAMTPATGMLMAASWG
ncbi:MAG: hypothetical protein ACK4RT_04770 [Erythrobacter sp.]